MDEQPMQGRVALVAGASKGIGASTAEAFARAGAAVVLGARNADALQLVVARIESRGGRAIGVRTDVADVDSMRNLVDRALATYGRGVGEESWVVADIGWPWRYICGGLFPADCPPSIGTTAPVTNAACSEQSHSTT